MNKRELIAPVVLAAYILFLVIYGIHLHIEMCQIKEELVTTRENLVKDQRTLREELIRYSLGYVGTPYEPCSVMEPILVSSLEDITTTALIHNACIREISRSLKRRDEL
jgi:hypothetical protein